MSEYDTKALSGFDDQSLVKLMRDSDEEGIKAFLESLAPEHRTGALCLAVVEKSEITVARLINTGMDLNEPTKDNWTPLASAVNSRFHTIVEMLLLAGADPHGNPGAQWFTPLGIAITLGDHSTLKKLIEHGASPHYLINVKEGEQLSAIEFAGKHGDTISKSILEQIALDLGTANTESHLRARPARL